jgi:hypothetical protein
VKRLLLILALLLPAVALFGCDTESDTPASERIVGTWNVTSANVEVRFNENLPSVTVPVIDANDQAQMRFTDGRYRHDVTGPISATVAGQTLTLVPDGQSAVATGDSTISEDGDVRFTPDPVVGEPAVTGASTFRFSGDDRVNLSVENTDEGRALIASLLGNDPQLAFVLDAVAGGSASLQRAD